MTTDRKTILLLGDIVMLISSFALMVALRFDWQTERAFITTQARMFILLFVLWLIVFYIFELYNLRRVNPNPRNIGLLALAITTSTLVSVLIFYITSFTGITPKTNLILVASVSFVVLVAWRRLFYTIFSSRFVQHIAVIGSGAAVEHLLADLKEHPHIGKVVYTKAGYDGADTLPVVDIVIAHDVDLSGLFMIATKRDCEIFSLFEAYEELFGKIPLALMDESHAIAILTRRKRFGYPFVERFVEGIFAIITLVISLPFVIVAMIAIALEDGWPVVYRQTRVGKNGKLFKLYKLRSMRKNAEQGGVKWAQKNDSRVTRVGTVLRLTHLDEAPQMINILRGDISLVGPRPERPEFVAQLEQHVPYYFLRHTIKPGFTGWAQIKFRYARTLMDSREKFEYDLYYLRNKNPLFDLGIFAKTIQIIFSHTGK